MIYNNNKNFYVLGINYKKANSNIRNMFSLDKNNCNLLLNTAKEKGFKSIFVLSTCNRTEIYTTSDNYTKLKDILFMYSRASDYNLKKYSFLYKGEEAINHFYKVTCGIDSQIIGDYEIVGQVKQSINNSKRLGLIDNFTERLFNNVIETSREIKKKTNICSGKTSISYAAVSHIKKNIDTNNKKIIVYGIGKIGKKICLDLIKHFGNDNITLVNRTFDNIKDFCQKHQLNFSPVNNLKQCIKENDILILSTRADNYLMGTELFENKKEFLIIDLSMPLNIDPKVKNIKNISILGLDNLSNEINISLNKRIKDIPLALEIIDSNRNNFFKLLNNTDFNNTIYNLKQKLIQIQKNEIKKQQKKSSNIDTYHVNMVSSNIINKITGQLATNISKNKNYLKVIEDIFNI